MSEFLVSQAYLEFLLFDWLKVDAGGRIDRQTGRAVLAMSTRLAGTSFLSCYKAADCDEPRLTETGVQILPQIGEALAEYAELGLFGSSFPEDLGGMALPQSIALAVYGIFASANVSAIGYAMLTAANARLIAAFGTPAQVDHFARPQIEGRWFGTMCLSEPQAGSSLGDVRTRAVADGEDELGQRYRLTGNKMWISGGDQDASENIVHLVLAKVAGKDGALPEGSKGISLFIVPKLLPDGARNDVMVAGLNHKMGNRGTSNCLLNLGENAGATGWLVGMEGQGLTQMFKMMNEARISVGMGAAALAFRGYRHALRYAQERTQGRPGGTQGGPPVPIISHPDVRRMLLQQKCYAEAALSLCLYCAQLVDAGGDEAEALLALLTPLAKSWPAEFGLIANDLAIQVHGGYGYTRDFDVEQLWRDNRLNPIHEGTTGIQAIDLLRRKILCSDGTPLAVLRRRVSASVECALEKPEWAPLAEALQRYWADVETVVDGLRMRGVSDALDDATLFMRAFGHGVVAWLWLDQAIQSLPPGEAPFQQGNAYACRFFFETELPQARCWLGIVSAHGDLHRLIPDEAFA